jgi:CRP-like cAMP-binding protein
VRHVSDLLALSADLPEVELVAGRTVVREGGTGGGLWVLVSGALRVVKDGVQVGSITRPGAAVGEVSLLLGTAHSATVEAIADSRLRFAADGHELLAAHPEITKLLAVGLAERLRVATAYLADLEQQYGDSPGISMVSEVLGQLAEHHVSVAQPGSARDPDPEY